MFHLGQPFCVSAVMPGMKPQARAIPSFIISYPIKNQGDQTYRLITAVLLAYSEPTINIFITKTCSIWGDIFVSPQSCLASMVDPKETLLSSILLQFWSPGHQKNRLIESDRLIYSSLAFEYTPLKWWYIWGHILCRNLLGQFCPSRDSFIECTGRVSVWYKSASLRQNGLFWDIIVSTYFYGIILSHDWI